MVVVTGSQGKSREWVQGSGFRVQGCGGSFAAIYICGRAAHYEFESRNE